jgi:hypothetical protein
MTANNSIVEIINDPQATDIQLRELAETRSRLVVQHPNCPADLFWDLVPSWPLDGFLSPAGKLFMLEDPQRYQRVIFNHLPLWLEGHWGRDYNMDCGLFPHKLFVVAGTCFLGEQETKGRTDPGYAAMIRDVLKEWERIEIWVKHKDGGYPALERALDALFGVPREPSYFAPFHPTSPYYGLRRLGMRLKQDRVDNLEYVMRLWHVCLEWFKEYREQEKKRMGFI